MITRIKAIPRLTMNKYKDEVINNKAIVAISIITPRDDYNVIFPEDTDRIITLRFSDITPGPFLEDNWDLGSQIFCTTEQARKIVTYIKEWISTLEPLTLLVNCSAGISRSGAIAKYAFVKSQMSYTKFMDDNYHIQPNQWVLWKLIEAEYEMYGTFHTDFEMYK